MKHRLFILGCLFVMACGKENPHPIIVMETNMGDIEITLDREAAPISVANILKHVEEGYYNDTIFHRIMAGFMIQCGGFDTSLKKKADKPSIKNESGNGLTNKRGAVAMARTDELNSATTQFFINLVNNFYLDEMKYAVLGEVTAGMEVVDKIAALEPINMGGAFTNYTKEPVIINTIYTK